MSDTTAQVKEAITNVGTKAVGAVAASKVIDPYVELWADGKRTPVYRRPNEVGLQHEDVFFPSMDGVALDGRFIPADWDRFDHSQPFSARNRYGYAGHLEGLQDFGGFEVNFLPEYKALHDAGYNILCYDMRNHVPQRRRQRPHSSYRSARAPGYDNIAAVDQKLHWIEGTDQRFRGYNYSASIPK